MDRRAVDRTSSIRHRRRFIAPLGFAALLSASCVASRQPTFERLAQDLDDYPLPDYFRFDAENRYMFNDGPQGRKINTIARLYRVDRSPAEVYTSTRSFLVERKVKVAVPTRSTRPDGGDGRIHSTFRGYAVTVFTAKDPVEVRIYRG